MEDIIFEYELTENNLVECCECTECDFVSEMYEGLCPSCVYKYNLEAEEDIRAINADLDSRIAYSLRGYR